MDKRNRSQSPAQARKRHTSTILISGSISPQNTTSSDTSSDTKYRASPSGSSEHSSRMRSLSFKSSSTSSPQIDDASSPLSLDRSLAQNKTSISTPMAVATYAGMITPGPLTPEKRYEPSHDDTVIDPCAVKNVRYPAFSSLTNYSTAEFFPVFETGDVFISTALVTPAKRWQLHSNTLAQFSSWFAKSLSSMATTSTRANWASYKIEEVDGKILLVQQQTTGERPVIQDTKDTLDNITFKIKNEDEDEDPKPSLCNMPDHTVTVDTYDQIFSAFYNVPINFPTTNIAASLTHSEQLTKIAIDLGCLETLPNLTSQINATLHQHRHKLLRAIKNDPARWLLLSLSLKNDSIYTESLIHISGAHPCWPWPTPRSTLPEETLDLITTKSLALDRLCIKVERSLLLLTIHVGRNNTSHAVSPLTHSEFDTWFIVSTFRSILGQELTALDNDRKRSLRRGTMFRKISKGEGYMPYEDMRRMMEQAMPSAVQNLSEDLAMLKREASVYVEGLARNECLIDVEGQKVGWLTCVKVGKEDIPWRAGEGVEAGR